MMRAGVMLMKNSAEVVIIGGGVVGCAIAYNLAKMGCKDVVVLEKEYLTSGATGRCGAGIRQQWGTEMNCRLSKASMDTFEQLNEMLDYPVDIELKQDGYLILAYEEKEIEQFKKNIDLQNRLGIASKLITPPEAQEIVPHLNPEGLLGAAFCGRDGHANPFHVTQAYADAARRLGVKIYTYTECQDIEMKGDKITGVITNRGRINTDKVVNAAGGYSDLIGNMVGLDLPVYSERHQIMVTEPVNPLQGPMVISFYHHFYCQQVPHGAFIMGQGDPNEPRGHNIGHSWQFLQELSQKIGRTFPVLRQLRIVRQWSGLYNMTPDSQPILCEAPEVPGFFLAIGFSGHGFMIAPMTGTVLAEMILGKELSMPVEKLDLGRFDRGELVLEPSVV